MHSDDFLASRLETVFGSDDSSLDVVEQQARAMFTDTRMIVWEGDPQTFAFLHVGGDVEELLGHAASEWLASPAFWVDRIVHPADRNDAVAYCALATGKAADHAFEYRALARDGRLVWLMDYVRVIRSPKGLASRLRGLMIDITELKERNGERDAPPKVRVPTWEQLGAA